MLKKRIIPCLDIRNGRVVKGVNFKNMSDAGDPVELAKQYIGQGADELVFLDISATIENRKTLVELVERVAKEINIPFTVGGGVNTTEDARRIVNAGADKVSINSAAVQQPELITKIAKTFGKQCVVVAIDTKTMCDEWVVCINGGTKPTTLKTLEWVKEAVELGAGEILLTSMNNDGTKTGFNLDITKRVTDAVDVPVIASGGAGNKEHFAELFQKTTATGALAARIFHYNTLSIPELKTYLTSKNIAIR